MIRISSMIALFIAAAWADPTIIILEAERRKTAWEAKKNRLLPLHQEWPVYSKQSSITPILCSLGNDQDTHVEKPLRWCSKDECWVTSFDT